MRGAFNRFAHRFFKCASMSADLDLILEDTRDSMNKAIHFFESELTKIRAGKANPTILDGIMVEYYGNPTPIHQVANVNVVDARTLSVQPWEKSLIQPIERAILAANIGITPQNDGQLIRLFLPPLTEERRKDLVKRAAAEGEHAKVAVRNIRRDAIEQIKKLQKEGLSEDATKDAEAGVQQLTDSFIEKVDRHCSLKEKEIMSI